MMEVSEAENMAINLLKPYNDLMQQVLVNDGRDIDINKVYDFYSSLHRRLELSRIRRKGTFEEVVVIT